MKTTTTDKFESPMTQIALSLLHEFGWSVIPVHIPISPQGECSCGNDCNYPGKHPRIPWSPYTERLPSEDEVVGWFEDEFFESNLGVVTGTVSDLVVVDLDGTLEQFEALGLPDTLTSRTGGGGFHFFYRSGRQPARSGISVTPGIDIKADGGFVVLPPSRHESGLKYEWIKDAFWRADFMMRIDPEQLPKRVRTEESNGEWVSGLLAGVSEGERSSTAARLAGRYAQLGLSVDETTMLLVTWNTLNSPPLSDRELGSTIRAVYRRHAERNGQQLNTMSELLSLVDSLTGRGMT